MALQKKSFNDIITFTRTTDATRYNASGLIELVPANMPRLDYDPLTKMARGLLCEETRTNLRTSSHMRDWSNGGSGTVFPGNVMAPDGSMDGLTIANTPGASSFINKALTAPEGIYTHSVFVKPEEGQPFTLVMSEMKGVGNISFNAVAKTFSGGAPRDKGFQEHSNGWIRVWVVTESAAQTPTTLYIGAYGATNTPNRGAVWGYQVELGSFVTSYIPTLDAQVTRTGDIARVNNLSPWYNPNEGTLFVDVEYPDRPTNTWFAALTDGGLRNTIDIGSALATGVRGRTRILVDNVTIATRNSAGTMAPKSKLALAYGKGQMVQALNSVLVSAPAASLPVVNQLGIGNIAGFQYSPGWIRAVRYYPYALTDAQLQALTT